jgi:hypothetical protein
MGAAAAQDGAKWERRQHQRELKRERRQHKMEQNGSGGSTRWSKMGAAAAQKGAKWERRQHKRELKRERRQEQHGEQRRADCWAFGSGVGVS